MKYLIQKILILLLIVSAFQSNAVPIAPPGFLVKTVASGGLLAGQELRGIVIDPVTANVYVAATPAGFSFTNFNLYKITPAGVVSFVANYPYDAYELVEMTWGPDGNIYTLDFSSGTIYKINPTTTVSSVHATNVGSGRHSMIFDANDDLIISFELLWDFYKVTPPSGKLFLGTTNPSPPNFNHGDAFGILPNGDYVIYNDCGGENNYAVSTAGHVPGADYSIAWTGTTDIFTIMAGCGKSFGTVDPISGKVFTSINNFGSGNSKIIVTEGSGGPSTVFIDGGTGITAMATGKASDGSGDYHLYFVDRITNTVYEVIPCDCIEKGSKNGSFETACLASGIGFPRSLYGWTTNDFEFEVWTSGTGGVNAYHGNHFLELNSNFPATIHQDIDVCATEYYWQIAHHSRGVGPDHAIYEVGPVGGPYTTLADMIDGPAWGFYSGNYSVPPGTTTLRIRVRGVGGGSIGNFIDAVAFSPSASCVTADIDGDGYSPAFADCDDNNAAVKPCAQEICDNLDNQCNGLVDGDDPEFVSTDPNDPNYFDDIPPVVSCPDLTVSLPSGDCGPVPKGDIDFGVTVADNCIVYTLTNNAPNNFKLGNKNVKWTATDKKGNVTMCTQKVTIEPYYCGQAIQIYHTDTTESSAKIKWKAGICATNYQLRIREELSPGVWSSWSSWSNYNGDPVLQHIFTALDDDSFFNYQIRTKCGTVNSIIVNGWFHTLPFSPLRKSDDGVTEKFALEELSKPTIINSGEVSASLMITPNPAKEFVKIELSGFDKGSKELSMMDIMGKLIFKVKLSPNENNPELELKRLNVSNGIHLIRVADGKNQRTVQLLIER